MQESRQWLPRVEARLDRFLADHTPLLTEVSPDLAPFVEYSRTFLSGGKRFRARCALLGFATVQPRVPEHAIDVACALEVFHAAALVHDDIMDNSDTRRGSPSVHRLFESLHRDSGWVRDGEQFGVNSALLLGDLLLAFSDELFASGISAEPDSAKRIASRAEFNRMRLDVTAGQYLDIAEEVAWPVIDKLDALPRAQRVVIYKSAKYSIEAPLVIGAALAGASETHLNALRHIGLPLGIAFQLRDDILGVFGDPTVTGKPAGDDLREGKRTVLIALAQQELPTSAIRVMDELLGDADLDANQISTLQETLKSTGAVRAVERMIDEQVFLAHQAIEEAALGEDARQALLELAEVVTNRSA